MDKVLFSSRREDWCTPQWLFDQLDAEFHFTLDPCCTDKSAKCEQHYTLETDGLKQNWGGRAFSVIHHTAVRFVSGAGNRGMKHASQTLRLSC